MRTATVKRQTHETTIEITLALDGTGQAEIETGVGFLDHMLNHIAVHGLFDLTVKASGDLQIDLPEASTTLPVRSVSGRTVNLAAPIPDGLGEAGTYLLARGPARRYGDHDTPHAMTGFEIESRTDDAVTVREYRVFACDEITLLNSRWVQVGGAGR